QVKAIITVAVKNKGMDELLEAIITTKPQASPKDISYGEDLDKILSALDEKYSQELAQNKQFPHKWLKIKIIEGNLDFAGGQQFKNIDLSKELEHLRQVHNNDIESLIAEERYALASGISKQITSFNEKHGWDISQNIDKIILNKFLAIPIFLAVMWLMFKLTFDVSTPFIDWTDSIFSGALSKWVGISLSAIKAPEWFISLTVVGVIGGVGFVLVVIPVIFAMMFFITFLEASGYMARAAFITDRLMRST